MSPTELWPWRKTEKKIQTRNRNLDCDDDVQIGKNGLSLGKVIYLFYRNIEFGLKTFIRTNLYVRYAK